MKSYLISSKPSYSQLRRFMPDFALYRDKKSQNYEFEAQNFVEICKSFHNMRCFLHQDYKLAAQLGADGVHLTSEQFDDISDAKKVGLEVVISTHSYDEVYIAEAMGADYVTYSPIFKTPDKGEPKGVDNLKEIVAMTDISIFALGGIISEKEVEQLNDSGVFGFASIRYFQ